MEGFGPEKLIFILVIVFFLFGAKRLPEIGSSLGKGIREFKKSVKEISEPVQAEATPQIQPTVERRALIQPVAVQTPVRVENRNTSAS
jgi:sec-independent protein translocase protein TatA